MQRLDQPMFRIGAPFTGAVIGLAAIAATSTSPAVAQFAVVAAVSSTQSPQDLVNAFHTAFGEHHARAVHAKGIILEGRFTPDPRARSLSSATLFTTNALPVTARFSDFTGIPDIPDTQGDANPRGFAVKIKGANDEAFDVVTHSFNGFPTADSDEFAELLRSVGASGPGVAHPTPIEQFLGSHPVAKAFLTSQKPPPVSYATSAYFGVNAIKYTNAAGQSVFVRYRFVPTAGEHYLSPDEVSAKGPNYLREEIAERVARQPISFDWYAQVAEAGDVIDNPSLAWPETRKLVKLGTISITTLADDEKTDKRTLFLPGQPHAGIEAADPMLAMRNAAYPLSFAGRQ